jgi:elongation factor Tu
MRGPEQQTREHIRLAKQMGVSNFVVFFNKIELLDEPERVELFVLEGEALR